MMSSTHGIDLSRHQSVVIRSEDLTWADIIILMDRHNWQALRRIGAPSHRLVWLGALSKGPVEIPDPYGLPEWAAIEIMHRMKECTARLAAVLA